MEASHEGALNQDKGGPSHADEGNTSSSSDDFVDPKSNIFETSEDEEAGDDISAKIGKALKNFAPYFTRQIHQTMENAVNNEIAAKIKDEVSNAIKNEMATTLKTEVISAVQSEFDKRFPQADEGQVVIQPMGQPNPQEGTQLAANSSKDKYNYKHFSVCNPPTYDGNPDPIVSSTWLSEVEGSFLITQCPNDLKTIYGASMLRKGAKRWWDDMIKTKGEEEIKKMEWSVFKQEFIEFFIPEAEIAKLRSEFLNTKQGSLSLSVFKTQFLERAQFCPEYRDNDKLLRELFHRLIRKDIRKRISMVQVKSFSELFNVARGFEVEQAQTEDEPVKRKQDFSHSPSKRFKTGHQSGGNTQRGNIPQCKTCGKNHSGECRSTTHSKNCYTCGRPGHLSKDCRSAPKPVIVCFHCHQEGHRKSSCPSLSEAEQKEELRTTTTVTTMTI